jgi:hypothetical protein
VVPTAYGFGIVIMIGIAALGWWRLRGSRPPT